MLLATVRNLARSTGVDRLEPGPDLVDTPGTALAEPAALGRDG
jgi:hypothetical protein